MEDTKLILQAIQLVIEKVDRLENRLGVLEGAVEGINARLDTLDGAVEGINVRLEALEGKTGELEETVDDLKQTVFKLDNRVCGLALHIENVTDNSIQQVAEGHFFLFERLLMAEKYADPNELLHVRMNILEGKMEDFKARLA